MNAELKKLKGKKRLEYIFDYYKLYIFLAAVILYIIGYIAFRAVTYKETVVNAAVINIEIGEETKAALTDGYISTIAEAENKCVELNTGLILNSDTSDGASFEFTYASQMKLTALIADGRLDVVICDKSACDFFAKNGYLCDLTEIEELRDTQNIYAVPLNNTRFFQNAGFDADIYAGIVSNTKKLENAVNYILYLRQ